MWWRRSSTGLLQVGQPSTGLEHGSRGPLSLWVDFRTQGGQRRRVKCWWQGDHWERWVGSALWVAEGNFRKVKGYRDLPKLVAALENLRPRPPAAQGRAA